MQKNEEKENTWKSFYTFNFNHFPRVCKNPMHFNTFKWIKNAVNVLQVVKPSNAKCNHSVVRKCMNAVEVLICYRSYDEMIMLKTLSLIVFTLTSILINSINCLSIFFLFSFLKLLMVWKICVTICNWNVKLIWCKPKMLFEKVGRIFPFISNK